LDKYLFFKIEMYRNILWLQLKLDYICDNILYKIILIYFLKYPKKVIKRIINNSFLVEYKFELNVMFWVIDKRSSGLNPIHYPQNKIS
jgi:hypothetical protein